MGTQLTLNDARFVTSCRRRRVEQRVLQGRLGRRAVHGHHEASAKVERRLSLKALCGTQFSTSDAAERWMCHEAFSCADHIERRGCNSQKWRPRLTLNDACFVASCSVKFKSALDQTERDESWARGESVVRTK